MKKKKYFLFEPILGKEELKNLIPMGRYGSSKNEIASVVSFLASEGGTYKTGQNIRVDGGISRSV